MSGNDAGVEGAVAVAEALLRVSGAGVRVLSFGGNRIGDDGAVAIAAAIGGRRSAGGGAAGADVARGLQELLLGGNGISARGAVALAEAIARLDHEFVRLDLSDNVVDGATKQRIRATLQGKVRELIM